MRLVSMLRDEDEGGISILLCSKLSYLAPLLHLLPPLRLRVVLVLFFFFFFLSFLLFFFFKAQMIGRPTVETRTTKGAAEG